MKVAAYQAPLLAAASLDAIALIQERVAWCESEGVSILCCPEAILGGLADYAEDSVPFAIRTDNGQLAAVLAPIKSDTVTSIVGFTELAPDGQLFNTAAVMQGGRVVGLYRKLHPAIRRSVYSAGTQTPVFRVGGLTFGIMICNDSNFAEPAQRMAEQGATVLFLPTNTGLPNNRNHQEVLRAAKTADIARAVESRVWVIRADVAGSNGTLVSRGASGITHPDGRVVQEARLDSADFLIVEIDNSGPTHS